METSIIILVLTIISSLYLVFRFDTLLFQSKLDTKTLDLTTKVKPLTRSTSTFSPSPLLPTIPYYVYENVNWWEDCSKNFTLSNYQYGKHEDDIIFNMISETHKWRVSDPTSAKLFVIPAFLGFLNRELTPITVMNKLNKLSRKAKTFKVEERLAAPVCNNKSFKDLQNEVADLVLNSVWFKKNGGKDHLIVSSDWRNRNFTPYTEKFLMMLKNMSFGIFEEKYGPHLNHGEIFEYDKKVPWRCSIVTPYVSQGEASSLGLHLFSHSIYHAGFCDFHSIFSVMNTVNEVNSQVIGYIRS